jgi:hypothetical protein
VSDLTYEVRSTANTLSATRIAMRLIKERQMSREFESDRIEQVIMLAGLALFLVLATFIPA